MHTKKLENVLIKVLKIKNKELTDKLSMYKLETWDSLKHMELISDLENSFQIEFSMEEIISMKDIKSIKKIIKKKLNK